MTNDPRRSPAARDRAVRRLRSLTVGSALAGVAAMGGFGAVAAAIDRGATTTDVTTAAATTTSTPTTAATSTAATSTDTTATTSSTSTGVSATGGAAHATTGGS